jgi:hypothetical protein
VTVKDKNGNARAGQNDSVDADLIPKLTVGPVTAKSNGDGPDFYLFMISFIRYL